MMAAGELRPTVSDLFLYFFRLGVTAFGGPAMIPYIRELAVTKRQWLDEESFRHGLALCQTIPGAIALNTAAYVGLRSRGISGMCASAAGFLLPAFILIVLLTISYEKARHVPAVASLFGGLQVIVVAVVANATITFVRSTVLGTKDLAIALLAAAALFWKVNPFAVVITAGMTGLLIYRTGFTSAVSTPHSSPGCFRATAVLAVGFCLLLFLIFFIDSVLFDLGVTMAKIELFAFGGGYTAITLMFHEVVEARHWLDSRTFMDGVALGQFTPGPILITSAFIGYLVRDFWGAVVGTVAMYTPGVILLAVTMPFFERLRFSLLFQRVQRGIIASFVGLLLFVTIQFGLAVPWSLPKVLLCVVALAALLRRIDVLWVVVTGGIVSVLLF